ncbi:MAG: molybdopterin cofactor-binding domain-containing protein [Gemmatimonas sp.]
MSAPTDLSLSRRRLLQATGALIVGAAGPLPWLSAALGADADAFGATRPALDPRELDTWIAVGPDGRVTAFFGKIDQGQGVDVAVAQVVAEEIDVPLRDVVVVMGDTATSVNLGGASNSTGVKEGAKQLRVAAAEARMVLVQAAASKLAVPADSLTVTDGVVAAKDGRSISYADLVGGRFFEHRLDWNEKWGNALQIKGKAKPKAPGDYKIVGTSPPRSDVAGKVYGTTDFVTDVRLPGMVHARTLRPPVAGQVPDAIDESSIAGTGAQVVRIGDFVAVVADKEWNAVRAAQMLKVTWKGPNAPFPGSAGLYDHIRAAKVTREKVIVDEGAVDAAFAGAAKVVTAEYEWPFQSHAIMGPSCCVADIGADRATVFTGSQKPHYVAEGVAAVTGLAVDKVHVVWVPGPGSFGRSDADDAAAEAAVISKAIGKPVRVQGMREHATAWDPKGPAGVHSARAALDADGNVLAYEFVAKGFSTLDVDSHGSHAKDLWVGQVLGAPVDKIAYSLNVPAESYRFAAKRMKWQTVAPLMARASPLRTSHFRDTSGPQIHFASESFIDELAEAAGMDPVAFRLRHLTKERDKDAVRAAADLAGWIPRAAPRRMKNGNGVMVGQGIAYAQRGGTVVAVVADVEVHPSGRIWARRFAVAHDCGLIVNPTILKSVIEGNIVQATSRALFEEVQFDREAVTSVDWATYPIVETPDAPETIAIALINRPDVPSSGAGEPSSRPLAGAIANAVYDATGVRLRRAPFTPERVKAALDSIG